MRKSRVTYLSIKYDLILLLDIILCDNVLLLIG